MKRRPVLTTGLLTVIITTAAACAPSQSDSDKPACLDVPDKVTGVSAPAATGNGNGNGGIRVAESGFSELGPQRERNFSIGVILENTSPDQVAYRTRVTLDALDDDGHSVVHHGSKYMLRLEIPVILPGQRIPVGTWGHLGYREGPISDITVDLGDATWLPANESFAELGATFQALHHNTGDLETADVDFQFTSPYCENLKPRGIAVVFRDSTGTVIGGSFEQRLGRDECAPGTSERHVTALSSVPTNLDETKTQIYSYCDFTAAPPRTNDGPVN